MVELLKVLDESADNTPRNEDIRIKSQSVEAEDKSTKQEQYNDDKKWVNDNKKKGRDGFFIEERLFIVAIVEF